MHIVELDALPRGQVTVNVDQITKILPLDDGGSRIFFSGAGYVDVPHDFGQLRNALAGRETDDDGDLPVGFMS